MKKKLIIMFFAFILFVSGCTNEQNHEDNGKLKIVTSFFPPYDLVSKIGGDRIEVVNLTKTGNAHSFEPSIVDMENISKADLLVINGAGFEGWVNQIIASQGNLKVLNLSENLDLINTESLDYVSQSEDSGQYDPHTWLSPKNARKMLELVRDKLVELDSKNSDYYNENYTKFNEQFEDLINEYNTQLSKFEGRKFVPPHAAFNYVTLNYDIEQVAIEGMNSVSEPNASRMKEVIDEMVEKGISTVFYEYGQSDKIAQSIASEIDGNVLPITTLETISQEDIDAGNDYISLLRMNLENLIKSFEN